MKKYFFPHTLISNVHAPKFMHGLFHYIFQQQKNAVISDLADKTNKIGNLTI
jgi:hypothetical protein